MTTQPLAYRVLRRVKVKCPVGEKFCGWRGDYGDLQRHMVTAEHGGGGGGEAKGGDGCSDGEGKEESEGKIGDATSTDESSNATRDAYKEQADGLFSGGNYLEALELYTSAISRFGGPTADPVYLSRVHGNRAAARYMVGMYRGCVEDCDRAMMLDPEYRKCITRRGRALRDMGEFEEAVRRARQVEDTAEGAAELAKSRQIEQQFRRGVDMLDRREYGPAKTAFSGLVTHNSSPRVLLSLARCELGLGNVDRAARLSLQVNRGGVQAEAMEVGGLAALMRGDFDRACMMFKEGSRLDPDNKGNQDAGRKGRMAKSIWAEAMVEKGKREWERVVELLNVIEDSIKDIIVQGSELESMIYVERAKARLRMKDFEGSLKDSGYILYSQEDSAEGWVVKSRALMGLGREEEAMEDLRRVMESWGAAEERVREVWEQLEFAVRKKNRTDYYALFDLPSVCSEMEIKKKYKVKALELHPDKWMEATTEDRAGATEKFKLLGEGLEILTDDFKRRLYDEGYDKQAIEDRVQRAERAAHHRTGYHGHHGSG